MDVIEWASKIPVHDLSNGRGLCRVIFAEDFLNALKELQSAQPEERTEKRTETHACDLISGQAAIDVLHGYFDGMLETDTVCPADIYGLFECIPSAQPEQRWIPCSERLPEYDGELYMVTDYCEQINRKRIHMSYCYVNREGFWSDVPIGYKVIAWMPLPEPWKGEEQ